MSNIREQLSEYAKSLHISDIGICEARVYDELFPRLAGPIPFSAMPEERISPFDIMPDAKSIIMCVFSYYSGNHPGNIAKYARGKDYHKVVPAKLNAMVELLKPSYPDMQSYIFCDNSPMCDKHLAYLAGLGFWGKNSLLIHPIFGSYIFIGGIITDVEIPTDKPLNHAYCSDCGKCAALCPAGAISGNGIDGFACVSHLTQKRGVLKPCEVKAVKGSGSAWGCDICADVCPHNAHAAVTGLTEFKDDLIYSISTQALADKQLYAHKAFAWRGEAVLRRNLEIIT